MYVNLCLISPYIYAWFAVFGTPEPGSFPFTLMIIMESFFVFNIVFNFFVELEVDGKILPIRDLQTIALTYLKGSFIFELIPIIPLQFLPLNGEERNFYLVKVIRIAIGIEYADPTAITEKLTSMNLKRIRKMIAGN